MPEFVVYITKKAAIDIEAENAQHAEQIARDQEGDAFVEFDMEVDVVPKTFGDRTHRQWARTLEDKFGVAIYGGFGQYGYTGGPQNIKSFEEAVEHAVTSSGILGNQMLKEAA